MNDHGIIYRHFEDWELRPDKRRPSEFERAVDASIARNRYLGVKDNIDA